MAVVVVHRECSEVERGAKTGGFSGVATVVIVDEVEVYSQTVEIGSVMDASETVFCYLNLGPENPMLARATRLMAIELVMTMGMCYLLSHPSLSLSVVKGGYHP
jgi:hypothetical protein